MKKFLQRLNILKTDSQKELIDKLNKIDLKKIKERDFLNQKRESNLKEIENDRNEKFELWRSTFRKDFEFRNDLLAIAEHVKKNTNLDIFLEYSKDNDALPGYILFIIGNMNVHLSIKDKITFNVSTYTHNEGMNDGVNFDFKNIDKCKEFFKEEVLKVYNLER